MPPHSNVTDSDHGTAKYDYCHLNIFNFIQIINISEYVYSRWMYTTIYNNVNTSYVSSK